jgi:hypothetical protein
MSKFIKRLRKIKKHPENCILIGHGFGHLDEFCELFNNVFSLIVDDELPKKRNLIHRQNFDELSLIAGIDFIFVDFAYLGKIYAIENAITRFRCPIHINHGEFLDAGYSKFFGKVGYQITEINKSNQIWTPK